MYATLSMYNIYSKMNSSTLKVQNTKLEIYLKCMQDFIFKQMHWCMQTIFSKHVYDKHGTSLT